MARALIGFDSNAGFLGRTEPERTKARNRRPCFGYRSGAAGCLCIPCCRLLWQNGRASADPPALLSGLPADKAAVIQDHTAGFIRCGVPGTQAVFKGPYRAAGVPPWLHTVRRKCRQAGACVVHIAFRAPDPAGAQVHLIKIHADKSVGNGGVRRGEHPDEIGEGLAFRPAFQTDVAAAVFPQGQDRVTAAHRLLDDIEPAVCPPLVPVTEAVILFSDETQSRDVLPEYPDDIRHGKASLGCIEYRMGFPI